MTRTATRALTASIGLAVALAVGCAGDTKHKVVPVEGKLVFADGKPLPAGTQLRLDPAEGGMQTATGTIGDGGSFKLRHASGASGAEVGKYTVVLLPPKENAAEFYKFVPRPYYESANLFAEVKEGMSTLELKVPKAKR